MSGNHRQNAATGGRCSWKPPRFIKVSPASLTVFIALSGFAVAVVVVAASLAIQIAVINWKAPPRERAEPRATPLFLQIQALGGGETSTYDVVVDPEKNQWAGELVNALRQIQQALDDDDGSSNKVVIPLKENPWINDLILALGEAGKPRPCPPVTVVNPISNMVLDPKENPWIDELLTVLRSVVEPIDKTVCSAVLEQMECAADERLEMSDLIRFRGDEHALDGAAKNRIDEFIARVGGRTGKWGLFGFAGEAGDTGDSRELFRRRACEVKQYISKKRGCSLRDAGRGTCPETGSPETETGHECAGAGAAPETGGSICLRCKAGCRTYPKIGGLETETGRESAVAGEQETEFPTRFLGEGRFINCMADSHSVVIAACRKQD